MTIVLASASPRRANLLKQIQVAFEVIPANIDETRRVNEPAEDYVVRLACEKTSAVNDSRVILAADTIVLIDGKVLEKPVNRDEAVNMLLTLSGRSHHVLTGVAVRQGEVLAHRLVTTEVWFRAIDCKEVNHYVATGEADDKSGAYGIQGIGGIFVQRIKGSADNVAGLPLAVTEELLKSLGVDTWRVRGR